MVMPPRKVLEAARSAAKAEDYATALRNYEYFFEHALQDQGPDHNFYGVRLSYCLYEWARLGIKYPLALQSLESKAAEALAAFEATRNPEKFHDFLAIFECLGQRDAVVTKFVEYHYSNQELANLTVRFMWDRLVEAARWDVCSRYLANAEAKYSSALDKFDMNMKICAEDPSLGGDEFAEQIRGWYVRDVSNLLKALRATGQPDAAARLESACASDMESRGHLDLVARIHEQAAI